MKLKHIAHAFKALILGAVLASGFAIPSYAGKADIELLKSYVAIGVVAARQNSLPLVPTKPFCARWILRTRAPIGSG